MRTDYKIPKIIHYCWFGDSEKPDLVKKCIESWKTFLPDYEIREWNNKDLENCNVQYVQDAIKEKKWAFVSDYFRLYALYNYGGIYLDSDNEIFKQLDKFLNLSFFSGYEICTKFSSNISAHPFTALVGATKGNHIIKDLLVEYNNLSFYNEYGELNLMTNTQRVENYFKKKYNFLPPYNPNKKFELESDCIIFPANYFCNYERGISYAVHHFNATWLPHLRDKARFYITKNIYFKIYAVDKGYFYKESKNIKETIIFAYPRFKKSTVIITLGQDK